MKVGGIDQSAIDSMAAQLRSMASQAQGVSSPLAGPAIGALGSGASQVKFADVLKATLDKVDESQKIASKLGDQFAMGDDTVNISDVMIAGQKANISLQSVVQVRNRLVSAYHDIMSMSI